jgi:hypothetical protein
VVVVVLDLLTATKIDDEDDWGSGISMRNY